MFDFLIFPFLNFFKFGREERRGRRPGGPEAWRGKIQPLRHTAHWNQFPQHFWAVVGGGRR